MKKQEVILDNVTKTHIAKGDINVVRKSKSDDMIINCNDQVMVEHGEHAVVATEKDTTTVVTISQQEKNPLSDVWQNAYD